MFVYPIIDQPLKRESQNHFCFDGLCVERLALDFVLYASQKHSEKYFRWPQKDEAFNGQLPSYLSDS